MLKSIPSITFITMMVYGIFISLVSNSWFGVWVGMEMNLMTFIPLMIKGKSNLKPEVSLKYFFIQAMASLIFLQMSMTSEVFFLSLENIIFMSLMMKMGMAPFHFWLPLVLDGLEWLLVFLLLTIQKMIPLMIIFFLLLTKMMKISYFMIIISAMVGANGGVNEMYLRKMMAFSSISHMAWMMTAMLKKTMTWFFYYFIYIIITASILILLFKLNYFHINQLSDSNMTLKSKFSLVFCLMSLGGFPPLLGFLAKWAVITDAMNYTSVYILTILIISSLITLFYYMRVSLMLFTLSSLSSSKFNIISIPLNYEKLIMCLNLIGFTMSGLFWTLN
uniref:NADH-ubiquinone oxidoreductase chain 2 n=1 Tax=Eophreatoicus karrkkanj TaxID=496899 RepID=D3U703_9CRUS|nr:NADH dehydrogenase subunit 2 [Eophreatoicus sp. 14 FK-2009]ACN72761.1 NADH dehydrogenase subunit 2 [Eophreatoicus karrkkanj]